MKEIAPNRIHRRTIVKSLAGLGLATLFSPSFPLELLAAERVFYPGEVVTRGDRVTKRMFVTIDDGGNLERVSRASSIAASEGVKLTFFPTGLNVEKDKSTWADVLKKGHDLENHTWSHQNLKNVSKQEVKSQLFLQKQVVQETASIAGIDNYPQIFLRPPYGAGRKDTEVVSVCKEMKYVQALWSSDPQGWRSSVTEDIIYQRFVSDFSNGLIMLFHTNEKDMNVLPRIIRAAKERGYVMDKTMREGIKTSVYP